MQEEFMLEALKLARKAFEMGEIPVGAVIVKEGNIIGKGYNYKESKHDATNHAEIMAIKQASKHLNDWRLENCQMYVTLEPCLMCAGAIIQARIPDIYIGTKDLKTGAVISKLQAFDEYGFNHKVKWNIGILEDECSKILKDFFDNLRKGKVK